MFVGIVMQDNSGISLVGQMFVGIVMQDNSGISLVGQMFVGIVTKTTLALVWWARCL